MLVQKLVDNDNDVSIRNEIQFIILQKSTTRSGTYKKKTGEAAV